MITNILKPGIYEVPEECIIERKGARAIEVRIPKPRGNASANQCRHCAHFQTGRARFSSMCETTVCGIKPKYPSNKYFDADYVPEVFHFRAPYTAACDDFELKTSRHG